MNRNRNPQNNICRISGKECIHPFIFYGDPDPIFPGDMCLVRGYSGHWAKAEYLGPMLRVYAKNDGVIVGSSPVHSQGSFLILKSGIRTGYGRSNTKRCKK